MLKCCHAFSPSDGPPKDASSVNELIKPNSRQHTTLAVFSLDFCTLNEDCEKEKRLGAFRFNSQGKIFSWRHLRDIGQQVTQDLFLGSTQSYVFRVRIMNAC